MFFTFYKRLLTRFILSFSAGGSGSKSKESSSSDSFTGIKDPFTLDAIRSIIGLQGLTPELREQRAGRKSVADQAGRDADSFSLENAVKFGKDAVDQLVRQSREANAPIIDRAVEGAGTSGNALAALLTNDLTTRTAQAGGTLAAQIATEFGQVAADNRQTQANLSQVDSTGIQALLEAIKATEVTESVSESSGSSSAGGGNFSVFGG